MIAREEEAKRQERISAGQAGIDSSFAGYNDDLYNKYQQDYTNTYVPQLDDQYEKARKRLILDLAKTGNATSSAGIGKMGELKSTYDTRKTGISGDAINATNQLRANVDNRKSQLYADNRNAADPGNATSLAYSASTALKPVIPTNPLADSFAEFFNNAGNAAIVSGGFNPKQNGAVQNFTTRKSVQEY